MSRVTNQECFLCRSLLHEIDIECDPDICFHDEDDGPEFQKFPHHFTITKCVECDERLKMALAARDLIKENEAIFRQTGASVDQDSDSTGFK